MRPYLRSYRWFVVKYFNQAIFALRESCSLTTLQIVEQIPEHIVKNYVEIRSFDLLESPYIPCACWCTTHHFVRVYPFFTGLPSYKQKFVMSHGEILNALANSMKT